MTDEERQRQMDFIVNHQAELTVKMDKAEVRITRLENVLRLAIRAGLRERKETREKIKMLIDAHVRLAEAQARTEAAVTNLAESQLHTDNRLDALIEIVRKERNGNSDSNGEPSA